MEEGGGVAAHCFNNYRMNDSLIIRELTPAGDDLAAGLVVPFVGNAVAAVRVYHINQRNYKSYVDKMI